MCLHSYGKDPLSLAFLSRFTLAFLKTFPINPVPKDWRATTFSLVQLQHVSFHRKKSLIIPSCIFFLSNTRSSWDSNSCDRTSFLFHLLHAEYVIHLPPFFIQNNKNTYMISKLGNIKMFPLQISLNPITETNKSFQITFIFKCSMALKDMNISFSPLNNQSIISFNIIMV